MRLMKIDGVKLRIKRFIEDTIDLYFQKDGLSNKLMNATAKIYVNQNMYKLDKILCMFGDKNGEIDIDLVLNQYESILMENGEFRLNVKEQFGDSLGWLGEVLPNRIVLFRSEDIHAIFD